MLCEVVVGSEWSASPIDSIRFLSLLSLARRGVGGWQARLTRLPCDTSSLKHPSPLKSRSHTRVPQTAFSVHPSNV